MAAAPMRLSFEGISRPVEIEGGRAILPVIRSVFRYWPFREVGDDAGTAPIVSARKDGSGYRVHTGWRDDPPRYSNPVNLACGLGVQVNRALLEEQEAHLCFHGAALEIGGRLVLLPNYYRAGKSTLTACLAGAGARVFTDDILPVRPDGAGMALGISPRLRLPLPDAMGVRSRRFVERRRGAANKQYLYVEMNGGEQARFGETAPIGGIVLLNRHDSRPASLEPASEADVLKQLVLRNFVRQMPAATALEKLHGFVAASICYRLTFSDGDEASDLLMKRYTEAPMPEPKTASGLRVNGGDASLCNNNMAGGEHPRRKPGISERPVGEEIFLVDAAGETIYHLNSVGAGFWRLMDGTCGLREAVAVLHQAFPDVDRARIDADVGALARSLQLRGLLLEGRVTGRDLRCRRRE